MILPDWELIKWAMGGGVNPFRREQINPASLDLCIGTEVVELVGGKRVPIKKEGVFIGVGYPILATTVKYIKMPLDCAGVLYLKSTPARRGLDHALAGFVDPGFEGELTMELHAHRGVFLKCGQRIVQLVLYRLESLPEKGYHGKYQGQRGPTRARG